MPRRAFHRSPQPSVPEPRPVLLGAVLEFVGAACHCPGVHRIALVGSLTTATPIPKDADVLVTIEPGLDLAALAQLGRRLKGKAQTINLTADIFLAEPDNRYIGRTCSYRECHYRVACTGVTCGHGRLYLKNDLHVLTLSPELVRAPPVQLWPSVVRRCKVPADVEALLLGPLESQAAAG